MEIRVEVAYQREITEARHPLLQDESYINGIKLELQLWLDCFKSRYWYRTHVGIGMMFFQQFVGMKALAYNVPILLGTLGASIDIQIAMPGIFAAVHLLGALTCLWTIDTFGRKRVLVSGSSLMLVCLIIIAGLNSKFSDNWSSHPDAGWCCVGISILCILAFGAGWSPVSWALPSEVFPSTLRAKGGALSACSYWLWVIHPIHRVTLLTTTDMIFFLA
jgi:MFS family permease